MVEIITPKALLVNRLALRAALDRYRKVAETVAFLEGGFAAVTNEFQSEAMIPHERVEWRWEDHRLDHLPSGNP